MCVQGRFQDFFFWGGGGVGEAHYECKTQSLSAGVQGPLRDPGSSRVFVLSQSLVLPEPLKSILI